MTQKKTFLCSKCSEQNLKDCSHCFVCGESGHRAVGCLKRSKNQGKRESVSVGGQPETGKEPKSQPVNSAAAQASTKHTNKKPNKQSKSKPHASSIKSATNSKVPLVGKKSLLKCLIGGYPVTVLFDSGSQVSIVDRQWVKRYIPTYAVRPLQELLNDELEVCS